MRSYERQGVEFAPTVHMGPAITNLERRGIRTVIGDLNRDIVRENKLLQTIQNLLSDLLEKKSIRKRLKQAEEAKHEARQQQNERGKDCEPNRKKKSYEQDL
jgi:hypothetical protein